jgi:hypothetical protein
VGKPIEHVFTLWNRQVPVAEYTFTRAEVDRQISWTIYDFFVLPAGGFVTAMSDVRKASADYRTRPYGAAQVQVIFDSALNEPDRLELLHQVLAPFGPVIDSLQLKKAKEGAS